MTEIVLKYHTILDGLNVSKATGPDRIPPLIISKYVPELRSLLYKLFPRHRYRIFSKIRKNVQDEPIHKTKHFLPIINQLLW